MFELPDFSPEIPLAFRTGGLAAPIERLAQTMADMGAFDAADLRTGQAGATRMVERCWQRWYREDGLAARQRELPINFSITAGDGHQDLLKVADPTISWLVLENYAAPARWYLFRDVLPQAAKNADFAAMIAHVLATIYAGLDDLCYAAKPPEYLAWARAFWWDGQDREAPMTAEEREERRREKQTLAEHPNLTWAIPRRPDGFPTRKAFDLRYAVLAQAPKRTAAAMDWARARKPYRGIANAVAAVDRARRSPALLRANMHEFSPGAPGTFACIFRCRYQDFTRRLIDDYEHAIEARGVESFGMHGAWPLATEADIVRARRGIAANARLVTALVALLRKVGYAANQSHNGGGFW